MSIGPWIFLIILLVGAPAASYGSIQIDNGIADNLSSFAGNATGLFNVTAPEIIEDDDSPPASGTVPSGAEAAGVVINEVELNPRGSDVGGEWIELYNPGGAEANVSFFEIRTSFKSASIRLPSEATIDANGTYVVELDRQMLSNIAESLVLANVTGETVDRTPSLVDRSDDGRTWQRIPDGNDEWQFEEATRDELNDPGDGSGSRSARSGSADCLGTAGCAEGVVVRIVDGDTLYARVNGTLYKVDLALTSAPSRAEEGFIESTSFTRNLCLGSSVLVDQDDMLMTSSTSIIAVVYCASANLNSELLESGHAELNLDQCETSEFASEPWARDHGC